VVRRCRRAVRGWRDSAEAQAVKIVTRAHKTLIWERTRHMLRLRHALREFFPARWPRSAI
jgi:hypothetical protein